MKSIWELGINDMISPAIQKIQAVALRAYNQISSYEGGLEKKVASASGFFKLQQNAIGKLGSTAASVLGIGGVTDTISSLGMGILKVGSNMEQTRTAFNVMLGSTDLAKKKMGELQKFADFSPFNTQEVFDAGQKLLGFKVSQEKLLPVMNMLGDVSQGQGDKFNSLVDNYGKMVTAQKANTDDLNQFANAGVPIWDELGKILGKTGADLRKHVEDHGASVGQIDQALQNLTTQGGMFHGMMQKQSETTAGRYSTLASQFEQIGVKIYDALQPVMTILLDWGSYVMPVVEQALKAIWHAGLDVSTWLSEHAGTIAVVAGAIGGLVFAYAGYQSALGIIRLMHMAHAAAQVISWVAMTVYKGATIEATLAQLGLNAAFLASPITWVAIALGALVAGVIYAMQHFDGFRETVYGLWEAFKQLFRNLWGLFKATFEPIFLAIDAAMNGDWARAVGYAALQVAEIATGATGVRAGMFIAEGGLSKDVKKEFRKGKAEETQNTLNRKAALPEGTPGPQGSNTGFSMMLTPEQQKELKKPASPIPFATHAGTPTAVPGSNTGSPSTGNGGSSSAGGSKNIIINIQNLVGEVKFIGDLKTNIPNAKAQLKEALLSVVNDTQLDMA